MCGIYFCLGECKEPPTKHVCLSTRGPDLVETKTTNEYFAAFHRLAIVGVADGMQPFIDGDLTLLCNGEIYNHLALKAEYQLLMKTHSDCECILHLYRKIGIEGLLQVLDGEFAFVLYDAEKKVLHFARDRLGRKPLYYSMDPETKQIDVCSLLGGLEFNDKRQVIPRQLYTYAVSEKILTQQTYHLFRYMPMHNDFVPDKLLTLFAFAVKKRVTQAERPVGFLLSGGFDSSLVLSVALRYRMLGKPPHVFTIGFSEDAPDIKSAELMVRWLRQMYGEDCIVWHKIIVPLSAGIDALPKVVEALETYDTTTIRASTPMYLISKYISENTDVKVVLSGEGSDELFGGYLYFKFAPNDYAFRAEIIDRLNELYLYDVLRADRTTAAWGLEIRPPFLDDDFVTEVLKSKRLVCCKSNTKELARYMADVSPPLLPYEILHGKKEAFSDAVGMTWKGAIQLHANEQVRLGLCSPDRQLSVHIHPETDEMKYFQHLFMEQFGPQWHVLHKLWLPNQDWVKTGVEPSARVLPNYSDSKWLVTANSYDANPNSPSHEQDQIVSGVADASLQSSA